MKSLLRKLERVRRLPRKNAVLIRSAEGRGVGTTLEGAEDAKRLAQAAGRRAMWLRGSA